MCYSKAARVMELQQGRHHTAFPGGLLVSISCKLRVLLARVNVERARQGQPPLSLRRLAAESGVSLSVVAALNTGRSQRIDYATIDHLLTYFSTYFDVTTDDLLTWEREQDTALPVALSQRKTRSSSEQWLSP
jgi:DNA-binding Xre family transcriptional regulator